MGQSRPDPAWLPLRVGVLTFQHSPGRPDQKPAELIQDLCDLASKGTGIEIDYDPEGQRFWFQKNEASAYPASLGSYRLGDHAFAGTDSERQTASENDQSIVLAAGNLIFHLRRILQVQLEHQRCRIFARIGLATAAFSEVPPDVFGHYRIVDWRNGSAEASRGEKLFSIHPAEFSLVDGRALDLDGGRPPAETMLIAGLSETVPVAQATNLRETRNPEILHPKIRAIYLAAQEQGVKPPNVNELPKFVRILLEREGLTASTGLIRELGGDERYKPHRVRVGVRASDLRPLSELKI
jgi:hypothetical protein